MMRAGFILAALLFGAILNADAQQTANLAAVGSYSIQQFYPNASVTGTTSETNLAVYRIPAGTLGPKGMIRVTALWSTVNNANSKTLQVRFVTTPGATSGGLISNIPLTTVVSLQALYHIRAMGITGNQSTYPSPGTPFGVVAAPMNITSVNMATTDSYLNFNATLSAGTDTVTLIGYTVETINP